ncbi:hypothetical protein HYH02_009799 [Chlamydomonas schloesseri]|uniref:Uncharacterized protein n=1 Tax=Chlamydomonas schloesseri TaxID=2026947 RepID=A0A835TE28_9CHLO|nr:hypothetical protein HYH02_009799 [Chlamydomonas schloesseri]|eukprot:KAG2442007.1 hypothetical protein HYH02_009799 [Chlamydomonas schloesseri]
MRGLAECPKAQRPRWERGCVLLAARPSGVFQHQRPCITAPTCRRIARHANVEVRAANTGSWHTTSVTRRRGPGPRHSALVGDLVTALALPAEPAADELARWINNLDVLSDVAGAGGRERVRKAVLAHPSLLAADLERWHSFFVAGFGLPPDSFAKLAADCPALLTHGDVWTAGCIMLFFKSMGWRNKDIAQRIIGYYPQLLLLDRGRDIDPVVRFLDRLDCRGDNLRLLVWEYPRIFDKDYRRHIRKFQYLGVYGLSLHSKAAAAVAEAAATDGGDGSPQPGCSGTSPAAPEWI